TNKKNAANPLIQDQTQLVPNVTHVFTQDQHMYLKYEVYDPAKGKTAGAQARAVPSESGAAGPRGTNGATAGGGDKAATAEKPKAPKESVHVLTSIEFLQGNVKVYESKQVVAMEVNSPER